ncbi:hypothetical protein [Jiangella endophytica]|uniref:hypothetical protein n=1 Tax=Jiangella endophytica TaxID=1623398 RepID=UPI0013005EBC|nr:hypothetical protein [Jiangella endophytica]
MAQEYLQLAEFAASEDRRAANNAAAGNAVQASIAAADAICCLRLGRYHTGEDHRAAVTLLERVQPNGTDLARDLAKVLAIKDQAHYSGEGVAATRLTSVLRSATRLVGAARALLDQTR